MRAVIIRGYGGPEVLETAVRPRPVPRADEVLVRVHAASINPRDWLTRMGRYQFRFLLPPFPVILGSDVSGVVTAVGKKVHRFAVGDPVFGIQHPLRGMMGGCAEFIAVPQICLVPKPETLSHVEAAALPLGALTAWRALVAGVRIRAGQAVLIIGGMGSVGSCAIQIAKAAGARVTAVCGTRNVDRVRGLGADEVIDYQARDFHTSARDQDIVFDTIGRESAKRCAPMLKRGGAYITTIPNPRQLLSGAMTRLGLSRTIRAYVVLALPGEQAVTAIGELAARGVLKPTIDTIYDLDHAAEAHQYARSFHTRGKLVFRMDRS